MTIFNVPKRLWCILYGGHKYSYRLIKYSTCPITEHRCTKCGKAKYIPFGGEV